MKRRAYDSPLREAQAAHTREQILQVTHDFLAEHGISALTLPELAKAAGVSAPTVYRYFPTVEALLTDFLAWIRARIGHSREALVALAPDQLASIPESNFPRFEAHAAVLKAVMDSPTWNRIRVGSMADRAKLAAQNFQPAAPQVPPAELAALLGPVYVLASPQTWRWLRETWGLDAKQARETAAWAMQVLTDAIKNKKKRRTT
jgi:AcrR family transcriptional regulator